MRHSVRISVAPSGRAGRRVRGGGGGSSSALGFDVNAELAIVGEQHVVKRLQTPWSMAAKSLRPIPQGGGFGRRQLRGKFSPLRKVAKLSPGEIWGVWQCSVCVRQCWLSDLQGGEIFPLQNHPRTKLSPPPWTCDSAAGWWGGAKTPSATNQKTHFTYQKKPSVVYQKSPVSNQPRL